MKLTVTRAENGYIVKTSDSITVVEAEDADAARALAYVLWNYFGIAGDRHDDKRPYVVIAPGDKRPRLPKCPFCDHAHTESPQVCAESSDKISKEGRAMISRNIWTKKDVKKGSTLSYKGVLWTVVDVAYYMPTDKRGQYVTIVPVANGG